MYGKLFSSMYEGTLYGHWKALVTFQQMIILCDQDGVIDMTPNALAARTSIPLDIITEGIKILESPDPYSRTPGDEGRRIELLDDHRPWGWRIINHSKYRALQDAETVREQTRERVRKHRERKASVTVTDGNGQKRHTDTDTDTEREPQPVAATPRKKVVKTTLPEGFDLDADLSAHTESKLPSVDLPAFFESFKGKAVAGGWKYANWRQAYQEFVRNCSFGSGHWAEGQYPKQGSGIKWR